MYGIPRKTRGDWDFCFSRARKVAAIVGGLRWIWASIAGLEAAFGRLVGVASLLLPEAGRERLPKRACLAVPAVDADEIIHQN